MAPSTLSIPDDGYYRNTKLEIYIFIIAVIRIMSVYDEAMGVHHHFYQIFTFILTTSRLDGRWEETLQRYNKLTSLSIHVSRLDGRGEETLQRYNKLTSLSIHVK
jgi:hypothetical protein